jgi:hypothetical protein
LEDQNLFLSGSESDIVEEEIQVNTNNEIIDLENEEEWITTENIFYEDLIEEFEKMYIIENEIEYNRVEEIFQGNEDLKEIRSSRIKNLTELEEDQANLDIKEYKKYYLSESEIIKIEKLYFLKETNKITAKILDENMKEILSQHSNCFEEKRFIPKNESINIEKQILLCLNINLDLFELHSQFLKKIKETQLNFKYENAYQDFMYLNSKINEVYLKFIQEYETMKKFLNYITQFDQFNTVYELTIESFFKEENVDEKKKKTIIDTSIDSLYISPIQRLPRYELLIKQMIKNIVIESENYKNFEIILKEIEKYTNIINEAKRDEDGKVFTNKFSYLWERQNIEVSNHLKIGKRKINCAFIDEHKI